MPGSTRLAVMVGSRGAVEHHAPQRCCACHSRGWRGAAAAVSVERRDGADHITQPDGGDVLGVRARGGQNRRHALAHGTLPAGWVDVEPARVRRMGANGVV